MLSGARVLYRVAIFTSLLQIGEKGAFASPAIFAEWLPSIHFFQ